MTVETRDGKLIEGTFEELWAAYAEPTDELPLDPDAPNVNWVWSPWGLTAWRS